MTTKTKPLPREIDVADGALESYGIPKDSTLKLRRSKKVDVSDLTAWESPNGVKVTHAFEDADTVTLFDAKTENFTDTYPKDKVLCLGIVERVYIPFAEIGGKIAFDIEEVPTNPVWLHRMKSTSLAHLGAKVDYLLVIESAPVLVGDFAIATDEKAECYRFGVYSPYFGDVSLDLKDDKSPNIYIKMK